MTSGSDCRHLNTPQTEEARRSIRLGYQNTAAKLQHFPSLCPSILSKQRYSAFFSTSEKSSSMRSPIALCSNHCRCSLHSLPGINEAIANQDLQNMLPARSLPTVGLTLGPEIIQPQPLIKMAGQPTSSPLPRPM